MSYTKEKHTAMVLGLECLCLAYHLQGVLAEFKDTSKVFKFETSRLLKALDVEIQIYFYGGDGMCNEGQLQYIEIANKIQSDLVFADKKLEVCVLANILHDKTVRLSRTNFKTSKAIIASARIVYQLFCTIIDVDNFVERCVLEANQILEKTMQYMFGTFEEQVQAIQEFNYLESV